MTIEANIKIEEPDEVSVSMQITMPLKQWKRLKFQLAKSEGGHQSPSWELKVKINQLIDSLEKTISADPTKDDSQD